MGAEKVLENQIPAGWSVFVQERGFISSKQSQEVRFGIVHPIPVFHRKPCIKSNWNTPKDISFVAGRLAGSTFNSLGVFSLQAPKSSFKKNLAAWRRPLQRGSGGWRPWPPLSLHSGTYLQSLYSNGKTASFTCFASLIHFFSITFYWYPAGMRQTLKKKINFQNKVLLYPVNLKFKYQKDAQIAQVYTL